MKEFNRLTHAYIADTGTADDLAMAVVCSRSSTDKLSELSFTGNIPCRSCKDCIKASRLEHPDIITVSRLKDKNGKLKKNIVVEQIRDLKVGKNIESAYIIPNEAARKAYIINDADTMNDTAQNAFLNLLEEPPAHAVFILKAANPYALLPTVRSRCINMKTVATQSDDTGFSERAQELAGDFISALDDNMSIIRFMFNLEKTDKQLFSDFVAAARVRLAQALSGGQPGKKIISADMLLTEAEEMLNLNVNTGHISGMLCASLLTP